MFGARRARMNEEWFRFRPRHSILFPLRRPARSSLLVLRSGPVIWTTSDGANEALSVHYYGCARVFDWHVSPVSFARNHFHTSGG